MCPKMPSRVFKVFCGTPASVLDTPSTSHMVPMNMNFYSKNSNFLEISAVGPYTLDFHSNLKGHWVPKNWLPMPSDWPDSTLKL